MTESAQTLKDSLEILIPYLDKLADSIGNNGTYVFDLAVRQSYITGFIDLSYFILCAIFAVPAIICLRKADKLPINHRENYHIAGIVCIVLTTIFGASGAAKLAECITCLANPEYNAIVQLLHTIK